MGYRTFEHFLLKLRRIFDLAIGIHSFFSHRFPSKL